MIHNFRDFLGTKNKTQQYNGGFFIYTPSVDILIMEVFGYYLTHAQKYK